MELGYRDPFTYKQLPLLPSMRLTTHVLNIENLIQSRMNVAVHQYIHELSCGMDPQESKWYKNIIDKTTRIGI
jgi:hypothetical protein